VSAITADAMSRMVAVVSSTAMMMTEIVAMKRSDSDEMIHILNDHLERVVAVYPEPEVLDSDLAEAFIALEGTLERLN
jgi:GTPase Era involved in 16S rRNA processing